MSSKPELPAIIYSEKDKSNLNHALGSCLAVQRTYGKQAADFDKVVRIFMNVLKEYEPEKVIQAIKEWILKSPEFPTPTDILDILNPQIKLDSAVYRKLTSDARNGTYLSPEKLRYIDFYEQNIIKQN